VHEIIFSLVPQGGNKFQRVEPTGVHLSSRQLPSELHGGATKCKISPFISEKLWGFYWNSVFFFVQNDFFPRF